MSIHCDYPMLSFWETFARNSCGGITIMDTLYELKDHYRSTNLEKTITYLIDSVSNGDSLSSAMKQHPYVFGKHVVCFVEGGEKAGVMDKAFLIIVEQAWRCPECILKQPGMLA